MAQPGLRLAPGPPGDQGQVGARRPDQGPLREAAVEEVLAIHEDQIRRYGGAAGLRDRGLLESALVAAEFSAYYEGPDLFRLAATYLWTYPALVDRVTLTDSGFADHLLSNSSGDRYPRAECPRLRL
jgi:hypothetical protein